MRPKKSAVFEFDRFRFDPRRQLLLDSGKRVSVHPKALDLLFVLLENRHRVISKEELMQALWPDAVVEESNLTQNVFQLRKALGDDAHEHRHIVTLHGSGYRFVSDVRAAAASGANFNPEGWGKASESEGDRPLPSIAVLPFRPLSADPTDEYLGHGIAETLTAKLSSLQQLTVRPTAGIVLKEHGPQQEPVRIGRRLGVAWIVYGTVLRVGTRIRITVHDLSVQDGTLNWVAQFEGELAEILTLQDQIAAAVAGAVVSRLTCEEKQSLKQRHTENTDAYLTYVKGRYFLSRRSPEGFRRAADYFEKAARLDPTYALAFAGSADCNCLLACYSVVPPLEAWPKAKCAALRALEIDARLAEAHATLGLGRFAFEWDWAGAERECLRALALNPDCAIAHDYYADCLTAMGRHDEAIVAVKRAQELDPLSLIINCDVGANLYRARQYQEAVKQLENTVTMDTNFALAHWVLGCAYNAQGLHQPAVSQFEEAFKLFDDGPLILAALGHSYASSGERGQALKIMEQLREASLHRYVSPFDMAILHIGLGDIEEAFGWLEKACVDRSFGLAYLKADPSLDPIRFDARFKSLLRRLGLE